MNDNFKKFIAVGAKGRIICSLNVKDQDIGQGADAPVIDRGTKVMRTGSFEVLEIRSGDFVVSVDWDAIPDNLMDAYSIPRMFCLYPSKKKDGSQDFIIGDRGFSNIYINKMAHTIEGSHGERTKTDVIEYRFN